MQKNNNSMHVGSQAMKPRQLMMIGLGSAIGAGLFLGSGEGVQIAGPAVLVSYLVAGVLVIVVMNALGEMAVANPSCGAFSIYAADAFGPVVGATVGWLWWLQMIIVVAAEAVGAGQLLALIVPGLPSSVVALVSMGLFTAINLQGVRHFGEFEFWFAILKVLAIVAFIIVGIALICGFFPTPSPGLRFLLGEHGFAPRGLSGICSALLVVIFAFGGTEVVAIAAAETRDSAKNLAQTIRLVALRILVFYIASISIIVTVVPWTSPALKSPFAAVLKAANFPNAGAVMTFIAALALLSALNVNLYGSSRVLFSLAQRHEAPHWLKRLNNQQIPTLAVLSSASFGFVAAVCELIFPGRVLGVLLNCVGSSCLLIWTVALLSQWKLRVRANRAATVLPYLMWGFPWVTLLAILFLLFIAILSIVSSDTRINFMLMVLVTLTIAFLTFISQMFRKKKSPSSLG